MRPHLTALDVVVLIAYLAGTTALGMWVGRRQKDSRDYFVADRSIPWWAVLFSIVASETSALALIISPTVQNKSYVMPTAVLILGALTMIYTYRGGMKAVVWTEIVQASVDLF